MVTKRKPRQAFVTEPLSNSKASICQNCYENNITSKLVVYPKDPEHFKVCGYCGTIYDKRHLRYESLPQPLGIHGIGKVKFEVVEYRRRTRVDRDSFEPTEEPIPFLNGKPDRDLENLLSEHNGILVSCVDENVESEQNY